MKYIKNLILTVSGIAVAMGVSMGMPTLKS